VLNLGAMRHEVRIEKRTSRQADSGQPLDEWDLIADGLRAERLATPGRELWAAQQQAARVPVMWKLRFRADVAPEMRLICAGKLYDITSVIDPEGKGAELVVTSLERVGESP
jgi:SPP1 family predicted phage head-tail adaptor